MRKQAERAEQAPAVAGGAGPRDVLQGLADALREATRFRLSLKCLEAVNHPGQYWVDVAHLLSHPWTDEQQIRAIDEYVNMLWANTQGDIARPGMPLECIPHGLCDVCRVEIPSGYTCQSCRIWQRGVDSEYAEVRVADQQRQNDRLMNPQLVAAAQRYLQESEVERRELEHRILYGTTAERRLSDERMMSTARELLQALSRSAFVDDDPDAA